MRPNSRELAKSLEELIFGRHADKNRRDIQRFVTTLLDAVRDEVVQQTPRESEDRVHTETGVNP